MAELARKFIPVRIQSMNGVNLNLFPFERDLTLMIFFMNADNGIYARYGGREDEDAESHLTKASLCKVMREVLNLHEAKASAPKAPLADQPPRTPEDIPAMTAMIERRKVKCIHCHDVKHAELRERIVRNTFERDQIFTYPTPSRVGIKLDPDDQTRIASVLAGSPASKAGVKAGDVLRSVGGERVLSLGDVSAVLEAIPDQAELRLALSRDGQPLTTTLELSGDWRRSDDPSWRPSVGIAGPNTGFWALPLNEAQKRELGLSAGALALKVSFLFPNHRTPIDAGLKLGDVVIEFDGRRTAMLTRQMQALCQMHHEFGDTVPIVILRDGKEQKLTLRLPDHRPEVD